MAHLQCKIDVWEQDCESFESIINFGERAKALDRLDIVLLNTGTSKVEWIESPTGHEATVQVNHLATAITLLTPPTTATIHVKIQRDSIAHDHNLLRGAHVDTNERAFRTQYSPQDGRERYFRCP